MKKLSNMAVVPAILIALFGTASLTALVANWDKIFRDKEDYLVLEEIDLGLDNEPQGLENKEVEEQLENLKQEKLRKEETKILKTVVSSGIKFDLLGCKKQEQIVCNFYLTAIDRNKRHFQIFARNNRIIIDGEEYTGTSGAIGRYSYPAGFRTTLIQGVPMKSSLTFPIVEDAEKIAVMEIDTYDNRTIKVYIRDIPLQS